MPRNPTRPSNTSLLNIRNLPLTFTLKRMMIGIVLVSVTLYALKDFWPSHLTYSYVTGLAPPPYGDPPYYGHWVYSDNQRIRLIIVFNQYERSRATQHKNAFSGNNVYVDGKRVDVFSSDVKLILLKPKTGFKSFDLSWAQVKPFTSTSDRHLEPNIDAFLEGTIGPIEAKAYDDLFLTQ